MKLLANYLSVLVSLNNSMEVKHHRNDIFGMHNYWSLKKKIAKRISMYLHILFLFKCIFFLCLIFYCCCYTYIMPGEFHLTNQQSRLWDYPFLVISLDKRQAWQSYAQLYSVVLICTTSSALESVLASVEAWRGERCHPTHPGTADSVTQLQLQLSTQCCHHTAGRYYSTTWLRCAGSAARCSWLK